MGLAWIAEELGFPLWGPFFFFDFGRVWEIKKIMQGKGIMNMERGLLGERIASFGQASALRVDDDGGYLEILRFVFYILFPWKDAIIRDGSSLKQMTRWVLFLFFFSSSNREQACGPVGVRGTIYSIFASGL